MPWAIGIWAGLALGSSVDARAVVTWLAVFGGISLVTRHPWAWRLLVLGAAFCLGMWRDASIVGLDLISPEAPVAIEGRVFSHPERVDAESIRFLLSVRSIEQRSRVRSGELDIWIQAPVEVVGLAQLGNLVRLRGYLRPSIGAANLRSPSLTPYRLRLESPRFLEVLEPAPRIPRCGTWLRERVLSVFDRWPRKARGPAKALILGDRNELPEAWMRAARASGAAHLLAVSGLHLGILVFLMLGGTSGRSRTARISWIVLALVAYGLTVGPKAAISRAVLMALWILGFLIVRRPPQILQALAGSVVVMLWLHPPWIHDLGFQLSVSATLALVVAAPAVARWWLRGRSSTRSSTSLFKVVSWSMAASLCAQAATLPMLWPITGLVHPLGPLLDLVAIPWLTLTLSVLWLLVLGSLGLEWVWPDRSAAWSAWVGEAVEVLVLPLEFLSAAQPGWGGATVGLPVESTVGSPVESTVGWAVVGIIAVLCCLRWGPRCYGVCCLLFLGWTIGSAQGFWSHSAVPADTWRVAFLDVGQGDAVLLQSSGYSMLVDGGGWRRGDSAGRVLVPALADLGVRRLDSIWVTHGDQDHCGGLEDLRSYLPVDEIFASPGWGENGCISRLIGRSGARWHPVYDGWRGRRGHWQLEVLWPDAGRREEGNARSMVIRARAGGKSVLLTGDLEAAGERDLLRAPELLKADVLKVAHHGSKTSTIRPFLRAVRPKWAVVSAGWRNRYRHPHPHVLASLQAEGVRTLRTDGQGIVLLHWARQERGGISPLRIALPATPVPGREPTGLECADE